MEKIPLCCYLLSWENCWYTKCCFLLSVGTLHRSWIKFLIENKVPKVILWWAYARLNVHFWSAKEIVNGKNFLIGLIWLFKCFFYVINHYPVKFGVHRTCGIGDITFLICHETSHNHVIKELCEFVHCGPIPQAINFQCLVVVSQVKSEI